MIDVQNQIERMSGIERIGTSSAPTPEAPVDFKECAIRWAAFCLRSHKDGLLRKGLALAAALTEYDAELRGE